MINNTAIVASATPEPSPDTAHPNSATQQTTVRVPQDYGDAPPSYGTLLANDGARHIISNSLHMGANVDSEANGQASLDALGDDILGIDDEDGVTVPGVILIGGDAAVIVNASGVGRLDAWVDFNRNGTFESSERIATGLLLAPGNNTVSFVVPPTAVAGGSFARFRLSTAGVSGPTGPAPDGEVEDYALTIGAVTPGTVTIVPDPENPGVNMLLIVGTAAADSINVKQVPTHLLKYQVTFNRQNRGTFAMSNFRRVVIFGGAGDDTLQMQAGRTGVLRGEEGNDKLIGGNGFDILIGGPGNDTLIGNGGDDVLFGGAGNDSLSGGNGNDLLLGGIGNDSLSGGNGRDVLIGGLGVDQLNGNAGDDILIGGTTAHDDNRAALAAIMATWTSRDGFQTRVSKLAPLINPGTVFDDAAGDRLDGGTASTEHDWYIDYLMADATVNFNSKADKKN
jgi:Ca2+-binding RTX toxin-like protein